MDIRGFHYFNAVFEEKSIREAARRLFISPQGLGKIIRTMEGEFNTTFFETAFNAGERVDINGRKNLQIV